MKLLILLSCLLFNAHVFSQDAANTMDRPCAEDLKKFCAGVKRGEGRMMKCLKEHEKELSPACAAKKEEMKEIRGKKREKLKAVIANCKEDAQKLCSDIAPGHGGRMKCLKEKKDQLSDKCKAVFPSF
ncbi:MAG: cysteine rich repeat-containing protein [Bacteriovorax sp.]